ncbi:MAG: septal ring lytic transglycosylase RlpA family protein [Rickettsiaceae bacterium]
MYKNFIYIAIILTLTACSINSDLSYKDHHLTRKSPNRYHQLSMEDKGSICYKGHYKIGQPYKMKTKLPNQNRHISRTYKPKQYSKYNVVGLASWYGKSDGFHNRTTANGDIFNADTLTAAHTTLPMPSIVKVTNLSNKKQVIVLINDRGPFVSGRIIDLSAKAAEYLNCKSSGVAKVKVEYLPKETSDFLKLISMESKFGAKAKRCISMSNCSINCYIKLINLKHNIAIL